MPTGLEKATTISINAKMLDFFFGE